MSTLKYQRLNALLIGIDVYADSNLRLTGAVADVEAVKAFLLNHLYVPRDNIRTLTDKAATRDAIVGKLRRMANDPNIRPDDPILIYFAGHGTEVKAPKEWKAGTEYIQMLAPHDFRHSSWYHPAPSSPVLPHPGRNYWGISDVALTVLIDGLAQKKGDNIVVILDSCYSGSGTRDAGNIVQSDGDESDAALLERGFELDETIQAPDDLDDDILKGSEISDLDEGARAIKIDAISKKAGLRSHVLLSACSANGKARERNKRGVFTQALLSLLTSEYTDISALTYHSIIANILPFLRRLESERLGTLLRQQPQCAGENEHRVLFRRETSIPQLRYAVVRSEGKCTVKAGSVHGVSQSSQFNIFVEGIFCGTVSPARIERFSAELHGSIDGFVPHNTYAVPPNGKPFLLPVALDLEGVSDRRFLKRLRRLNNIYQVFEEALASARPPLRLIENKARAFLLVLDSRVTAHVGPVQHGPIPLDADMVHRYLAAAAKFFWHLNRRNVENTDRNLISIEVKKLKDSRWNTFSDDAGEGNLVQNGKVRVVADNETRYGIFIENHSGNDLFPYIFFFDVHNFSVDSVYHPSHLSPTGPIPDRPLEAGQTMGIGTGWFGIPSRVFSIKPGARAEVGFYKLFISTKCIDLSHVLMEPVARGLMDGFRTQGPAASEQEWDAYTLTVIQQRR